MQKKVIIALFVIVGASLGVSLLPAVWMGLHVDHLQPLNNSLTNGLIGAIIFYIFSILTAGLIVDQMTEIDKRIKVISLQELLFGGAGFIIGLAIGALISIPLFMLNVPVLNSALPIVLMVVFAYVGFRVAITRQNELIKIFTRKAE
ncbi:MAG: PIN domain nuclease, partial [Streptococcaceae bacterium]|nr:PIN domain nuclease [Streptococcaceae bacterium]